MCYRCHKKGNKYCMMGKRKGDHSKCTHPFFCSEECRAKWLDANWRLAV